jgi:hypothetical protein
MLRTMFDMMHCDEAARAAASKHQHAMLSLARMWLRADNCPMAFSAIEEALKTAHQLGDHATVAKSLFLLRAVFQASNDPVLVASAEDVLLRCVKRSAALDMQDLVAQSALLLAHLRSKQPFREGMVTAGDELVGSSGVSSPGDHASDPTETALWRVEEIWTQISFALLGEVALTRQVVTIAGISEDSEFTQSGPAHNMSGPNAIKKEKLQDAPLSVGPEFVKLSLQSALMACDLWVRLGMLQLGELACLRAIKLFGALAAVEDIVLVYVKLLRVQVRILSFSLGSTLLAACDKDPYLPIKSLLKKIRTSLPGASTPLLLQEELAAAELFVAAHSARAHGDWSRALRLAQRLADLSTPIATALTAANMAIAALRRSSSASGLAVIDPDHGDGGCSETSMDAQMLLAEITVHFDVRVGLQMFEELSNASKRSGDLTMHCLCNFMLGKFSLLGKSDASDGNALRLIHHSLLSARKNGFGLAELYISQFCNSSA